MKTLRMVQIQWSPGWAIKQSCWYSFCMKDKSWVSSIVDIAYVKRSKVGWVQKSISKLAGKKVGSVNMVLSAPRNNHDIVRCYSLFIIFNLQKSSHNLSKPVEDSSLLNKLKLLALYSLQFGSNIQPDRFPLDSVPVYSDATCKNPESILSHKKGGKKQVCINCSVKQFSYINLQNRMDPEKVWYFLNNFTSWKVTKVI